jgi:hypothetical protein
VITYCQKLVAELDEEDNNYSVEISDPIQLSEKLIEVTLLKISKLRAFVKEKGFDKPEDEIHFFKVLKPKIVSKLIYYNAIYKIETRRPYGGERSIKKYLNNELSKLKRFFDNNVKSGQTDPLFSLEADPFCSAQTDPLYSVQTDPLIMMA